MVEAGLCDILASDYFYPALLAATTRLVKDRRASLHQAWALVSSNPAHAMCLADRGVIETQRRADLVLIDWPDQGSPAITLTLSNGHIAHLSR